MAEQIRKLDDYQHVRLKTEMYFGSRSTHTDSVIVYDREKNNELKFQEVTYIPAVYTAFREIIDNALDEIAHGYGNRIEVEYDPEQGVFTVQDNGRGIPIDYSKEYDQHLATMVLTNARAGRNFGERAEVAGTNGIGGAGVLFCSEYMHLDIWRDRKHFNQRFRESDDELLYGPPEIKRYSKNNTGTRITLKLSRKVFSDVTLPEIFLYSRLYEIALANPYLAVMYNGERIKLKPNPVQNLFGRDTQAFEVQIKQDGFRSRFIIAPDVVESGEYNHSVVNNIPAFNGGIHMDTFRQVFYRGLLNALERESKKRKLSPNRSDITEGLLLYNITQMRGPNFDSQSKTRLINEEVAGIIRQEIDDAEFFKGIITRNRAWIDQIYERCEQRTRKKDQSDVNKQMKKMLRTKIPDLIDATGKDRTKCILMLTEGKSAVAGLVNARDPKIHAGLPLRGKVMNVHGESAKTVVNNQALQSIMSSIGLVIGDTPDRKRLNYGQVWIATDMDHDGLNIGALLINFFYKFFPALFDPEQEPFFYIFMTPFVIAKKGKNIKYWYQRNYHEFKPEDYKGWQITRAKGLGSLQKEDWHYSIRQPEIYPVVDDGELHKSLDLIFNKDNADARKTWIGL